MEISLDDKKDYNVNLEWAITLSQRAIDAQRASNNIILSHSDRAKENAYVELLRLTKEVLWLMATSGRFDDWNAREKYQEWRSWGMKQFDAKTWIKLDDLLLDIAEQFNLKKLMDVQSKKVKTRDMFK